MEETSTDIRQKGRKLFAEGRVKKEVATMKRSHFKVSGETEDYSVIFDKQTEKFSCDCKYFTLKQKECSHIFACRVSEEKI